MKRFALLLALAVVLPMVIGTSPAFAESPSERACDDAGGSFSRVNGTVTCIVLDPVGQSEHSGGKSQSTKDKEQSQGTFNNDPHHQQSCTGPGNSGEGGGPCPKS